MGRLAVYNVHEANEALVRPFAFASHETKNRFAPEPSRRFPRVASVDGKRFRLRWETTLREKRARVAAPPTRVSRLRDTGLVSFTRAPPP